MTNRQMPVGIGHATYQEITVSHETITAGFIGKINRAVARIRNSRRFLKDRRRQGENIRGALRDLCRMLALGFI
jgi:hypothetical protein